MIEVGSRYGKITILRFEGRDDHHRKLWLVSCDCGSREPWICRGDGISNGRVTSCGCARKSSFVARNTIHGLTSRERVLPEFQSWASMIQRCDNPNAAVFKHYGERGINVCDRWRDFKAFFDDMGNRPSPSHSIERIDNSKGYEPGNCRWATHLEQMQNTRWNRYVMLKGDRVCVSEAARRLGIKNNRIFGRVRDHGVTHQEAVDYFARLAA